MLNQPYASMSFFALLSFLNLVRLLNDINYDRTPMLRTLRYLNAGTANKSAGVGRSIIVECIRSVDLYVNFVFFAFFALFFASYHSPILPAVIVLELSVLFTLLFGA